MKKIINYFGQYEVNKYKNDYIKVNNYNFTDEELKEIKEEFRKKDFIKHLQNKLYKNGSLNLRQLIYENYLYDDIYELIENKSNKELWLNYNYYFDLIYDYFMALDEEDQLYNIT